MLFCRDCRLHEIGRLLSQYGLRLVLIADDEDIPGSYWGAPEAGLIRDALYFRRDTPVHSLLHEAAHYICATPERRAGMHTDAGGSDLEEAAVCYLQVLLAENLDGVSSAHLFNDMDSWGYSFRLGGAKRWFSEDAEDARLWLEREGILGGEGIRLGILRSGW